MRQMSKYLISFFVDRYMSVVIVTPLLATDKFFADCRCLNFLVDVITTYSNDLSEYSKCL